MARMFRFPGRQRRLAALSAGVASVLVLSVAPPASAAIADGEIGAGVNVSFDAPCTGTPLPAATPKPFSNATGKRTKSLQWTGSVVDPGDAADVTQLKATSTTTAKVTARRRSLDKLTVSGSTTARMVAAQGAASDCDTELISAQQVDLRFKVRKRGRLVLRWQRSGRGIISPMGVGTDPFSELNVFFVYFDSGVPSTGTVTRKVRPGNYIFTVGFHVPIEADQTQAGIAKQLAGSFKTSLTFVPRR